MQQQQPESHTRRARRVNPLPPWAPITDRTQAWYARVMHQRYNDITRQELQAHVARLKAQVKSKEAEDRHE